VKDDPGLDVIERRLTRTLHHRAGALPVPDAPEPPLPRYDTGANGNRPGPPPAAGGHHPVLRVAAVVAALAVTGAGVWTASRRAPGAVGAGPPIPAPPASASPGGPGSAAADWYAPAWAPDGYELREIQLLVSDVPDPGGAVPDRGLEFRYAPTGAAGPGAGLVVTTIRSGGGPGSKPWKFVSMAVPPEWVDRVPADMVENSRVALATRVWPNGSKAELTVPLAIDEATAQRMADSVAPIDLAGLGRLNGEAGARAAARPTLGSVALPSGRLEVKGGGEAEAVCLTVAGQAPACTAWKPTLRQVGPVFGSVQVQGRWYAVAAGTTPLTFDARGTEVAPWTASPVEAGQDAAWHLALTTPPDGVADLYVHQLDIPSQLGGRMVRPVF
jgi:hypothetical protein